VASFVVTRDLTKLRLRRQGERQKAISIGLMSKTKTTTSRFFLHFFAVPAQVLSVLENRNGKAINFTLSLSELKSDAVPSLQFQPSLPSTFI